MPNNEPNNSEEHDLQPIPEEQQDITTEEIVESDYNVVPPSPENEMEETRMKRGHERLEPAGRTRHDDSINASRTQRERTREGHLYSAGYDSSAATRIGDERIADEEVEHLRELNEGRHRTDGEHSIREHHRDKKRFVQGICTALPLASHEREKVMAVVQDLDLEQFGNQKGVPRVILGVVAVVIDERIRDCKTLDEMVSRSDEFKSTCKSHEVSMSDLSTIKSKVREALDEGHVRIPQGKKKIRRDPALPGPTQPDKRPAHYWEEQPAEYWESMAKRWEHLLSEKKKGVPDKYQARIEQLQKWKPWEDEENDDQGYPQRKDCESDDTDEDKPSMEEIMKEAEKKLDELDDESGLEFTE